MSRLLVALLFALGACCAEVDPTPGAGACAADAGPWTTRDVGTEACEALCAWEKPAAPRWRPPRSA